MKKTSEVLEEMRARFAKERREDEEAFEHTLELAKDLCNAGLVDDVVPDGPPSTKTLTMVCGHCGTLLVGPVYGDPDVFEEHRRICPGR